MNRKIDKVSLTDAVLELMKADGGVSAGQMDAVRRILEREKRISFSRRIVDFLEQDDSDYEERCQRSCGPQILDCVVSDVCPKCKSMLVGSDGLVVDRTRKKTRFVGYSIQYVRCRCCETAMQRFVENEKISRSRTRAGSSGLLLKHLESNAQVWNATREINRRRDSDPVFAENHNFHLRPRFAVVCDGCGSLVHPRKSCRVKRDDDFYVEYCHCPKCGRSMSRMTEVDCLSAGVVKIPCVGRGFKRRHVSST